MINDCNLVSELISFFQILCREQHGGSLCDEGSDDFPHCEATAYIKAGRWLVQEEYLRRYNQAGCQVKASSHSSRVGLYDTPGCIYQVKLFEELFRPLSRHF